MSYQSGAKPESTFQKYHRMKRDLQSMRFKKDALLHELSGIDGEMCSLEFEIEKIESAMEKYK